MTNKNILPVTWEVPDVIRQRLGEKAGRQRAMLADGHLLLVLHRPPKTGETERIGRFFWRQPDGTWQSSELGAGPAALSKHLSEYADRIQACDRVAEEARLSEEYFGVLETMSPLQRSARNLHAVLQEARQQCPDINELINFRDRAYDIERSAELLYEDTKNALDFALVKQSEQHAEFSHNMSVSAHRLNLLAAFFFPLVTLAALFGTNLKHGYEDQYWPWPFVLMIGVGLFCGLVLTTLLTAPATKKLK